jgi:hypothetical protein
MAVIRTVSTVSHYNMDISEEELHAVLKALRFRRIYCTSLPKVMTYGAETVQLITLIEGRLKHG